MLRCECVLPLLALAREKDVAAQRGLMAGLAGALELTQGICCLCRDVLADPCAVVCAREPDPLQGLPQRVAGFRDLARVYAATTTATAHRRARQIAELRAVCASEHTDPVDIVAQCWLEVPTNVRLTLRPAEAAPVPPWDELLSAPHRTFFVSPRASTMNLARAFVAATLMDHTIYICGRGCIFFSQVLGRRRRMGAAV
jgi:hypothetical protein